MGNNVTRHSFPKRVQRLMWVAIVVLSAGGVGLLACWGQTHYCLVVYVLGCVYNRSGMKKDKLLSVVPKRVTNKRRTPFTYTDTRNNTFHFRYKLAIERIGSKISHGQSRPWPQIRDRCNGSLADYVINIASMMMTPSLGSGSAGVTCCIGGARARYRPACFLK